LDVTAERVILSALPGGVPHSMYLTIRVLHVLCGAIWVGAAVIGALWLVPMTGDLGPDAAKVGASLKRRGYLVALPVIAATAIVSGIWLYWRFTAGFSPEVSRTPGAMVFGTGGILAIVSFLIGTIVISRSMMRATALMQQAVASTNENDKRRLMAVAAGFRNRAAVGGRIVAALVVITIVLMSIGHYI
jgi:hypothetical protein